MATFIETWRNKYFKMHNYLTRISKKYDFKIMLTMLQIIEKLDRRRVVQYWLLVIFEIFCGLLESLATLWIAVFASVFTNVESLKSNRYLRILFELLNIDPASDIFKTLAYMSLIMVFLIFLKNASFLISNYYRGKFLAIIQYYFESFIIRKYMEAKYEWFLNKKESDLLQKIQWVLNIVNTFRYIIISLSQITIMIILFITLIIYNYSVSLPIIFILSIIGSLFYRYIKNNIDRNEREVKNNMKKANSSMHNIIYDYKNIKINTVMESFYNKFVEPIRDNIKKKAIIAFLEMSPMFVFEILGFGIITFITIFMPAFFNWTTGQTMQYISLIAVTAWRIIPCMNKFASNFAKIRTYIPYVEMVFETIHDLELSLSKNENNNHKYDRVEKISFKDVSFSYDKSKDAQPIISKLTLDICIGEKIGIVGVSGSGKTTIIDLFSGILQPDSGAILVNDSLKINNDEWRKKISYLPQSVRIFSGTLEENIVFGYSEKTDRKWLNDVYKLSILEEIAQREESSKDKLLSMGKNLSGGQAQRLGIGRLLYRNTEIFIIDEGTASLDKMTEKKILNNVFNMAHDKILLLITHYLDNLIYCDKILAFLEDRKVIFGNKDDIIPIIKNSPAFFYENNENI